jgi:uncharacterized protein (DUF2147 family)
MKRGLFLLLVLLFFVELSAQSPIGTWKTFDHDTGEAKAHVQIFKRGGQLFGKIVKLLNAPTSSCDHCSGERKGKPLIGMEIMESMENKGEVWSGGKIYDPERDMTFRCKIWLDGPLKKNLKVRGYFLGFYKTQTWERVN